MISVKIFVNTMTENFKRVILNSNEKNFILAYSGGKDSSLLICLFIAFIESLNEEEGKIFSTKNILILNSDTLNEINLYQNYVSTAITNLQSYFKRFKNISVEIVKPELKNKFWNLIIGKGYTLPRRDYRWCSQRMKIKPMDDFYKKSGFDKKSFVSIVGARRDESELRSKSLESNSLEEAYMKKSNQDNKTVFAPIEFVTTNQVWELLEFFDQEYPFLGLKNLRKIYELGADNPEEKTLETRYGCVVCPMIKEDKTLKNIADKFVYFKPVLKLRNWLGQFQYSWDNRDYYNHRDYKCKVYNLNNHRKGMVVPGGYTLKFRKVLLDKVLKTEKIANTIRKNLYPDMPKIELLSQEDFVYIQECWLEEGDIFLSVKDIAKKYGKSFFNSTYILQLQAYMEEYLEIEDYQEAYKFSAEELRRAGIFCKEFFHKKDMKKSRKKVLKSCFLNEEDQKLIQQEWANDKISFTRFLDLLEKGEIDNTPLYIGENSLFGKEFQGPYAEHFSLLDRIISGKDPLNMEELSLTEKCKYIESF